MNTDTLSPQLQISVILPTHNPRTEILARTLAGLRAQTLACVSWELLIIDNASSPELVLDLDWHPFAKIIPEPRLGLTSARRCGFLAARAPVCLLVDDDNVLAADYLERVLALFAAHPRVGALGGRSLPEFATPPAAWQREFFGLLALRDPGDQPQLRGLERHPDHGRWDYPDCAPIGAGMALRRAALSSWLDARDRNSTISDRRGNELTSGGDNDIVLTVLHAGWQVGYSPELSLKHLIPSGRLDPAYLARLNRGIQKSWMQVLTLHGANPWPPVARASVPLRQIKAWFVYRAWSSPAARIRWQGACGHFEGRVRHP